MKQNSIENHPLHVFFPLWMNDIIVYTVKCHTCALQAISRPAVLQDI